MHKFSFRAFYIGQNLISVVYDENIVMSRVIGDCTCGMFIISLETKWDNMR